MLPPGIFLWDHRADASHSCRIEDCFSMMHSNWKADVKSLQPWRALESASDLDGVLLRAHTATESTIIAVESCESTMEVAKSLVQKGVLGEWGAVVAGKQESGRGQLRRPWVSSPGNLHTSIVLPSSPEKSEWCGVFTYLLPLFMGYVFCEVFDQVGVKLEIKWPNDLLLQNQKVGGMLIEENNGVSILGMGLNIVECPPEERMREDYSVLAGKIGTLEHIGGPLRLLELLVNRGKNMYAVLLDELKPEVFIRAMSKRLAWLGQKVLVREGGNLPYEARIMGLSPKGGLVLHCSGKETILFSGSIIPF